MHFPAGHTIRTKRSSNAASPPRTSTATVLSLWACFALTSATSSIPMSDWATGFYHSASATRNATKRLGLPAKLITATVKDAVARCDDAWRSESGLLPFPDDVRNAIEAPRKTLVI